MAAEATRTWAEAKRATAALHKDRGFGTIKATRSRGAKARTSGSMPSVAKAAGRERACHGSLSKVEATARC